MTNSRRDDAVWATAWEWVVREHEQTLDAIARQERAAWLQKDPVHLEAYQEAESIWLLAGLVPPPEDTAS